MRPRDLIFLVVSNLRRMKLRLALTALGVVIGTSAIVLMVSLGVGLQRSVVGSLGELGAATNITVMTGYEGVTGAELKTLDDRAASEFEEMEHVDAVMPVVMTMSVQELTYKKNSTNANVQGVSPGKLEEFGYKLAEGRFARNDNEIVIGSAVPAMFLGIFPGEGDESQQGLDLLGKRIVATVVEYPSEESLKQNPMAEQTERKYKLTVVGILEKADMGTDSSVYTTLDAALEYNGTTTRRPTYETVMVKADSAESVATIEKTLMDEGYQTFSARSIQDATSQIFIIVQVVLGALGGIAMIVAALGIANTMTMSIYERTREIGIMKAVGASNRQIKRVFLGEAAVIGVFGGLGGLAFSSGGAALANLFLQSMIAASAPTGGASEPTNFFYIPLWLAIFAVAFATGIGLLSGVLPAVRAANLDPLVALRHE